MRSEAPLDRDENPCRPRHFKPTLTPPCAADAPVSRSLDLAHKRLVTIGTAFALAFIVIGLRLADVTLLREPDAQVLRLEQPAVVQPVHYGRADILDRNGNVIATTLASPSLFANPHLIVDKPATARQLAKLLPGTNVAEIEAKLATDKSFVWLARHLTPGQEYAITALGIPGLDFEHEERRVYPAGVLAAHVAGYTDLDNKGLAGIERSFDTTLDSSREPLRLSIDLRLQAILKEEMQKQIDDYNGIGASGVVMDVRTGEILSLVSLPDFDPNQMREMAAKRGPSKDADDPRFNRATLGIYEMGSVFKIFNTALGLDDKKLTLASSFPTDPIHYGRFTIHDFAGEHIPNPANVTTIFMESSNIGSARMVQLSGPELQREFLGRLGLLRPAPIELPEVGGPEVPSPWREINAMTISYGHGLGVSQVQTAIAAAAVVNGGILHPASLIKHADGYVPAGERVLSEETSAEMRKLMRLVVTDGTGKMADVPGYLVGGKTGTPEKVVHGGYAKKAVMASFIGVFPMNDPQYMVYVTVDEPKGNKKSMGFETGGWIAAPAVKRVVARMAPLFGVKPQDETPDIHRAITIDLPGLSKKIAVN
ncbi:MAG TPA: penicillin-binding protein 2 [Stellaceae bacterium]|nr:penicillin-binding protein 2 [Stellaceae bacterium]